MQYLKDYQVSDFLISATYLEIEIAELETRVQAVLNIYPNPKARQHPAILRLDGAAELVLEQLTLNGTRLTSDQYRLDNNQLIIECIPNHPFELKLNTLIYPDKNTALEGLYASNGMYCTQCEAEGFRRITYYLDRPDVLSRFTTKITADLKSYPVLLSNGNLIKQGIVKAPALNKRHFVIFEDPFPKPSYLFAMVAGNLVRVEDFFVTQSGKKVTLVFYVEHENKNKCAFAIESLKKAMRWDEVTYGCEYDLETYYIVAVNDFNMGAMENKGLNIFNTKYILADAQMATDTDYEHIEAVIGHEYFHNWSGNRVTCRDWFQLSLKEGLTVFREQQFSSAQGLSAYKRIQDVCLMRVRQFAEDAGPMAHPVRPDSYVEIDNFYTMTVYNKGAEVVRMLHTLLGEQKFRAGMDLYFSRFDGQAVTTNNFVHVLSESSGKNLDQFSLWYQQAGTPVVEMTGIYNPSKQEYSLTCVQDIPKPMVIPIKLSFLSQQGDLLLSSVVVELIEKKQVFVFKNINKNPILSLFENFSAPVKYHFNYTDSELGILLTHSPDAFNQWDAAQQLYIRAIETGEYTVLLKAIHNIVDNIMNNNNRDLSVEAEILSLPSLAYLAELKEIVDLDALDAARSNLLEIISMDFFDKFEKIYLLCCEYQAGHHQAAVRMLKNIVLGYLMHSKTPSHKIKALGYIQRQFSESQNMTDTMGALSAVNHVDCPEREVLLEKFYTQWQHEPLIVNKWLGLHAAANLDKTHTQVKNLLTHPAFHLYNPNNVYALLGGYCQNNWVQFHQKNGQGYDLITTLICQLDGRNPHLSARLVESLTHYKRFDTQRSQLMRTSLEKIAKIPNLSDNLSEIVTKALV